MNIRGKVFLRGKKTKGRYFLNGFRITGYGQRRSNEEGYIESGLSDHSGSPFSVVRMT